MKRANVLIHSVAAILLPLLVGPQVGAGQVPVFDLRYQWAAEAEGPWEDIPPNAVYMAGDGAIRVAGDGQRGFFRLRIGSAGGPGTLPLRRLADLPENVRNVALAHVAGLAAAPDEQEEEEGDGDFDNWRNVALAPFVVPLAAGWEDEEAPRYAEIKVIAREDEPDEEMEDFLPDDSAIRPGRNRGYLIVSLDRSDFPVLQWATAGPSPSEELARLAAARPGARIARIVRFGSTLLVAEDEQGRPIANLGTEPFKILPRALEALSEPIFWDFDTEDRTRQEDPPEMASLFAGYGSYQEMKEDLRTNPYQRAIRSHRQRLAGYEWDVIEGKEPEVLAVQIGETMTFLEGAVFTRAEAQWEEPDDNPLARITILPRGGIEITGTIPGSALLSLYGPDGISRYSLWVRDREPERGGEIRPAQVVLKDVKKSWYAGKWADQRRYRQTKHPNWCKLVGCGPVSLAMLFGWWDHKGVPSAYYRQTGTISQRRESLRTADAPFTTSGIPGSYYDYLHDLCDVICNPFGNSGATWPADLIEGVHGYLAPLGPWWPFLWPVSGVQGPLIGYSTSWAWDAWGDDWHTSGVRVANGIKNGRPGIVGLGVLWHYALAYGYHRREIYIEIDGKKAYTILVARYFKCNEGWGKDEAAWYSAYDVFLGMRANLWQKTLP